MPIETSVTAKRLVEEDIQCNRVWISSININATQRDLSKASVQIDAIPYYDPTVEGDTDMTDSVFAADASKIVLRTNNIGKAMTKLPKFAQAFGAILAAVAEMEAYVAARKVDLDAASADETEKKALASTARAAQMNASLQVQIAQNRLNEAQAESPVDPDKVAERQATLATATADAATAAATSKTAADAVTAATAIVTKARLAWMDPANDA